MQFNPQIARVIDSPITQSREWAANWRGEAPLIDVSQAAPGYPPAESLRQHLAEMALRPDTAGYTDQLGIPDLRAALADRISHEYRTAIDAERVGITAGCNQAFCVAISALAGPGDQVLLPVPYYFNHDMWLRALGIEPRYLECDSSQIPDPDRAAAAITARTRAITLVTPNNPTGAIYPAAVLDAFFDLAQRRGLALIVDETYRDFRLEPGVPHRLLERPEWPETLIQLYSFSKAYCMTGHRIGAITASRRLLREVAKVVDCIAICPSHLGQRAALFALENLAGWKTEKRQMILGRMATFADLAAARPGGFELASWGGYFAYVRHPLAGLDSVEVARRLAREVGVVSIPGGLFGPNQEAYLRLAFANLDQPGIRELVLRLESFAAHPAGS